MLQVLKTLVKRRIEFQRDVEDRDVSFDENMIFN